MPNDEFIELTGPPTEEQFFMSKLMGLPFRIEESIDILRYRLIDTTKPIRCRKGVITYRVWNFSYVHDIKIVRFDERYGAYQNIYYLFPIVQMRGYHPELLALCEEYDVEEE